MALKQVLGQRGAKVKPLFSRRIGDKCQLRLTLPHDLDADHS